MFGEGTAEYERHVGDGHYDNCWFDSAVELVDGNIILIDLKQAKTNNRNKKAKARKMRLFNALPDNYWLIIMRRNQSTDWYRVKLEYWAMTRDKKRITEF